MRIVNGIAAVDGQYRFGWYFAGLAGMGPVTGDVAIEDCQYHSTGVVGHWEDAITVVYGRSDARLRIVGNDLEIGSQDSGGWDNDAIQITAYEGDPVANSVLIEDNILRAGVGIYLTRNRDAVIRNNRIVATYCGLAITTPAVEEAGSYDIEQNQIEMQGGRAAIMCGEVVSLVRQPAFGATAVRASANQFTGTAEYGVLMQGVSVANEFVITGREMRSLAPVTAHLSLAANTRGNRFTLVDGEDLLVSDAGMDNAIALVEPSEDTVVEEAGCLHRLPDRALLQNTPNPFNAGTVIGFSLPEAGDVDLAVYNLAGQRVATLSQGHRAEGSYRLTWDGTDGQGQVLASGAYVYRLSAGDRQEQARKLVLVR